jgi:hypothetical protein
MAKRTTVEVHPVVLKAIQLIAKRQDSKVKAVSDTLLRFAIPYEKLLFPPMSKRRDDGK